jgi:uncharacterized repeat protein (TIGR01451 family)
VCDLGDVAAGEMVSVTVMTAVDEDSQSILQNTATVSATSVDPDVEDDSTTHRNPSRPLIQAEKVDGLFEDADVDGVPSPGDTLSYTVRIVNSGFADATDVVFTDLPDENTELVVGSVQTTQGSTISGNEAGDTSVQVELGTLAGGGGTAVVNFKVVVDVPLSEGVDRIANQGIVTCCDGQLSPTDDPDTPVPNDETVTFITAAPFVEAYKKDTLWRDANGDGHASPGEQLVYNVTVRNVGNQDTTGVVYEDEIPAHTRMMSGSASTDLGTVISEDPLRVEIGALAGRHGVAHISYRVIIDYPLPGGIDRILNQGVVRSDQLPDVPTDDPDTLQVDDETETFVGTDPRLRVSKRDFLVRDADDNGAAGPGDTLGYRLVIQNTGNAGLTDIVVEDAIPDHTQIEAGTANTSLGTVDSESPLVVTIPELPGAGGEVVVTFQVVIDDPLPPHVSTIVNQAIVRSAALPAHVSDDPDALGDEDPTQVELASMDMGDVWDWHEPHCAGWKQRYTIPFTNDGGAPLTNLEVLARLPEHTEPVLEDSTPGAQYEGDGRVIWSFDSVAVGETVVLNLEIRVWSSVADGTVLTTCVEISSDQLAPEVDCEPMTIERCTAPTPLPTSTFTPTPTVTDTPVPTITPTPTGIVIEGHWLHLPLILHD